MSLSYFMLSMTELGVLLILVGALAGCYRIRSWSSAVQLLGAACMAAAQVIGYLVHTPVDPNTHQVKLGAVWQTQVILSSGGMVLFAIGYAAERLRRRRGSA
jgi:hypothetical protein